MRNSHKVLVKAMAALVLAAASTVTTGCVPGLELAAALGPLSATAGLRLDAGSSAAAVAGASNLGKNEPEPKKEAPTPPATKETPPVVPPETATVVSTGANSNFWNTGLLGTAANWSANWFRKPTPPGSPAASANETLPGKDQLSSQGCSGV